jgi:uncharacterized small protein (DUF1192 family)
MALFDDELAAGPARKASHEIGQDLSRLSVEELGERVALLQEEIERLKREADRKSKQRSAANLLFRQ